MTTPETLTLTSGNVTIGDGDWQIGPFPALVANTTWNGWLCPYFTRAVGLDIVRAINTRWDGQARFVAVADNGAGAFVFNDAGCGNESEQAVEMLVAGCTGVEVMAAVESVDVITRTASGPGKGLFAIGAWAWCWEPAQPVAP